MCVYTKGKTVILIVPSPAEKREIFKNYIEHTHLVFALRFTATCDIAKMLYRKVARRKRDLSRMPRGFLCLVARRHETFNLESPKIPDKTLGKHNSGVNVIHLTSGDGKKPGSKKDGIPA